jgi:hypothetical protein
VDALLRSAEQALRDSFASVFENLSLTLREHPLSSTGGGHAPGFIPVETTEPPMPPPPGEGASSSANA